MLKIGMQYVGYAEARTILNKVSDASYKSVFPFKKPSIYQRIRNKLKLRDITIGESHLFKMPYQKEIDFFHLFNSMLFGKNDWGVTFENVVPYYNENILGEFFQNEEIVFDHAKLVRKLKDPACKFLIAISNNCYAIQMAYLYQFPAYKGAIVKKMFVLHPPQKLYMSLYKKPDIRKEVHFMFLGKDLFRKGGIEVLRVFNDLPKKYTNYTLTIVGGIERLNKRFLISDKEIEDLKEMIASNTDTITYYDKLENNEVLELMQDKVHVGLLPTHADTYGYSVLEFQSAGCPVITTNIRALPEINNEACGWLIDIPKSKLGESTAQTDSELISLQNTIEKKLKDIVITILENPSIVEEKGRKAIQRIKTNHCPTEYSKRLSEIYTLTV